MVSVFLTHSRQDRDAYYARALPELEAISRVTLNSLDRDLTTAELIRAARECDVIVAHRSTPGDAELFTSLPRLVAFLRCAVDISTIDVGSASSSGVLVGHADKSFVTSTAELAVALMLDVARHVSESTVDYRNGVQPAQRSGFQVSGKTAGVIGFGAIGSYLSQLLRSMGMTVLVTDPIADATRAGFEQVGLHELLSRSHVVFPLAQARPDTENLIDAIALAAIRPGSILVNVSRGELLDEDAVAAALDSGHLRGLGIDVGRAADQRPSPSIASRQGVVATPHLGGLTPENADAQALSSVEQVIAIINGEMPPRVVNPENAERLRAWWDANPARKHFERQGRS